MSSIEIITMIIIRTTMISNAIFKRITRTTTGTTGKKCTPACCAIKKSAGRTTQKRTQRLPYRPLQFRPGSWRLHISAYDQAAWKEGNVCRMAIVELKGGVLSTERQTQPLPYRQLQGLLGLLFGRLGIVARLLRLVLK